MDGAGRAGLVRLLLGGAVALLALGVVVVLVLSGDRSTVAEAPSGESTAPADPRASPYRSCAGRWRRQRPELRGRSHRKEGGERR